MDFFQTLMRPDRDENPERGFIAHAANLLQVGEFQLLQLAFADWFGRDMRPEECDRYFHSFMVCSKVPAWARHYARRIINLDAAGELDDSAPDYHRYDNDSFRMILPDGMRRFIVAVTILVGALGGGLMMANYSARCSSILPPCYDQHQELPQLRAIDAMERK